MRENYMKIISFVIPACNAEKTIRRTIDSIIRSSFFIQSEIIIVENGSTDSTYDISNSYATNIENVYLYESEKGVSNARNLGIKKARGEWIVFVDADDSIYNKELSAVPFLLKSCEVDLVLFNYQKGNKKVSQITIDTILVGQELNDYKIKMIEKPTQYLNPDLKLAEDGDFMIRYLQKVHSILLSNQVLYCYFIDTPSTMRTFNATKLKGYIKALQITSEFIEQECSKEIQEAFNLYVLTHFNIIMVRENFLKENPKSSFQKIKFMHEVSQIEIFKKSFDKLPYRIPSLSALPLYCVKLHLYSLAFLIYKVRVLQNQHNEKKAVK